MADINDLFDFDSVDENEVIGYDALPAGEYLAEIKDATIKEFTGKGGADCKKLTIIFEVKDAAHSGAKVWFDTIFLHPGSAQAERIGRVQLKRLFKEAECNGSNTDDLIGRTLLIRTKLEKWQDASGNDKESARIVDFYRASSDTIPF